MLPSGILKKPRNELLVGIVLNHMVENLLGHPMFEEMCVGDQDRGIEPVDRGMEIVREQGSVIENTRHSFEISYTIESRGSPLGMMYTQVIAGGREDNGRIRLNYREFEILPPPRERVA